MSARAAVVTASFSNATDVPVTIVGYTATDNSVDLSLNFAPATGTTLTIVKNIGPGFIDGTFSNLAQGQAVALAFGADTYNFVANYYGGTGNDLVLQWAGTKVLAWGSNSYGQTGNGNIARNAAPTKGDTSGVLAGKTVIAVSAGAAHSLALCSDGTLAAWGLNGNGQLGNNSAVDSYVPVAVNASGVLAGKMVVAVAAGGAHSLALCSDGTLAAWGLNGNGQLGNNSTVKSLVPVAVTASGVLAGKNVTAIAAGSFFSMVLCSDGTLAAWGDNFYGQLGNNSTTQSLVPVAVDATGVLAGKTVTAIALGGYHSLALCSDGTVATWGYNLNGQLGNNSKADSHVPVAVARSGLVPTAVLAGKTVIAATAGLRHCLVLCSDGTLAAWGESAFGQLGNGTASDSQMPVAVTKSGVLAGKTLVAITSGAMHNLVLCSDGTLVAWGLGYYDQLGVNKSTVKTSPATVITSGMDPGDRFVNPTLGSATNHSLSLVAESLPAHRNARLASLVPSTGTLAPAFAAETAAYAMQVPEATSSIQFTPTVEDARATVKVNGVAVASGTPSASISLGYGDTVVRSLVTAKDGATRRLYSTTISRPLPGQTLTATFDAATTVPLTTGGLAATGNTVNLALNYAPEVGTTLTIVKNTGGDAIKGTFVNLAQGQQVTLMFGGKAYRFVANYYGGSSNDLVLQWAVTRVMSWGSNLWRQLGNDNNPQQSPVPVAVSTAGVLQGRIVTAVAAADQNSTALCSDGAVVLWGNGNSIPRLMDASGALAGKTPVVIAPGRVVLCSDGTVVTQVSEASAPIAVSAGGALAGKTVVAVAGGAYHTLALCSDGSLVAWNNNTYGQLGNNSVAGSGVPVAVATNGLLAGKAVIAIAAGANHSLALCSDGTLAAWGLNQSGQLGDGSTTDSLVPVAVNISGVLAGKTVIAISAGDGHSLALCSDGTVAAWGENAAGQLGNNSIISSSVPVAVTKTGVLTGRTVTSITAAQYHSLAMCSDNTLVVWGSNNNGQLGINSYVSSLVPVVVNTYPALFSLEKFMAAGVGSQAGHSLGLVAAPYRKIVVKGNGVAIVPPGTAPVAADGTDFGAISLTSPAVTHTFAIGNEGDAELNFTGLYVVISGAAAGDFQITHYPTPYVSVNGSTGLGITFDPSMPGQRNATVTITSNDVTTPVFKFNLTGFGALPVKTAQTITFVPPTVLYLGQSPLALSARSNSGLPVTLSLVAPVPSGTTLVGNLLTVTAAGVVKVQATLPASGNNGAAAAVLRTIVVKANPAALTLINLSQTYDGHPKPVATLGGTGTAVISYKVGTSYVPQAPTLAGSYPVKAVLGTKTVPGTLIIAKAPLTVAAADRHKYAGQANPAFTVTYSGFVNGETMAAITKLPAITTKATVASPGGVYPIIASGATAANYSFVYFPGTLVVDSFAGNYEALLWGVNGPVGKVTITVAATSKTFTARFVSDTYPAVSFSGALVTELFDTASADATTNVVVNKVLTPWVLHLNKPFATKGFASVTRGGVYLGGGTELLKISTKAVTYAGAHTAVMEPPRLSITPATATLPAGSGWATATANATGVLTFAGKLGDGTAFTTTVSPDVNGDPGYRLFVQPYLPARALSYLAGTFTLEPHPTLTNRRYVPERGLVWKKAGLPADASYRAGVDYSSTVLMIDPWLPPAAATKTVSAVTLAQRLGLSGSIISFGVSHSATGSDSQSSLPTRLGLSTANAVSVLAPATVPVNKTKWKTITFVPTTGTFTGSFELVDGTLKRPVTFSGVLRQPASSTDALIGDGHYLLPPITGTEKTTGEILFTRP